MAGFPRFFENCSRISSSSRRILVQRKNAANETGVHATPAKAATNTPEDINKVFVAGVADPTSYESVYERKSERPVLTKEQTLAIPLRSCLDCFRFQIADACCTFYDAVMSAPTRPCRCRHYRLRGTVH